MTIKDQAVRIINSQIKKLDAFEEVHDGNVPQWKDRTIRMLKGLIVNEELELFANIELDSWEEECDAYSDMLNEFLEGINENPEFFLIQNDLPETNKLTSKSTGNNKNPKSNKVFIVHGHDSLAKTEVARTIEKLGLEAIILHEQANQGKTIIEKFERDASQVSFAIVLLTPDDIGYPKTKEKNAKPRARQNVILELGYFSGVLGRSNVCVLYKGDVEIPSDYLGVVYIQLDDAEAWKFNIGKELKQAGMSIDLNELI